MRDSGKAVLDAHRVQHVASAEAGVTVCGEPWAALDLRWAETTRVHCMACLSPPADGAKGAATPDNTCGC